MSWAYTVEWPFLRRLRRLHVVEARPRAAHKGGDRFERGCGPEDPSGASDPISKTTTEEDEELAAYNRYLAELNAADSASYVEEFVDPAQQATLARYRAMAYVVGVGLLVLVLVGVPLQYAAGKPAVVQVVGPIHGFLYIVYLFSVADLVRRFRLQPRPGGGARGGRVRPVPRLCRGAVHDAAHRAGRRRRSGGDASPAMGDQAGQGP